MVERMENIIRKKRQTHFKFRQNVRKVVDRLFGLGPENIGKANRSFNQHRGNGSKSVVLPGTCNARIAILFYFF